jgi:predicted sugar kinase
LHELNARVGEAFVALQGGVYGNPAAVEFLRRQGVRGVGQSSWGPTVFGIVEDSDQAKALAYRLGQTLSQASSVMVTRARNGGAEITL